VAGLRHVEAMLGGRVIFNNDCAKARQIEQDRALRIVSGSGRSGPVGLELFEKVIVGVRANPEPDHCIAVPRCERSIIDTDTRRIDLRLVMNLFEAEAGMSRIRAEQAVGVPRLPLSMRRQ
jgi:hypothetical protein